MNGSAREEVGSKIKSELANPYGFTEGMRHFKI
jgi:hypothetical protein